MKKLTLFLLIVVSTTSYFSSFSQVKEDKMKVIFQEIKNAKDYFITPVNQKQQYGGLKIKRTTKKRRYTHMH